MSFLSRLDDLVDAGIDLVKLPVEVGIDLVSAPFTDDEWDGFKETLTGIAATYGAEAVNLAIGPEGVGGTLIGALPEAVRAPGRSALEGLEWAYREGVSQPVSTVMTMASLAESRGSGGFFGDDFGTWFDKDAWNQAREIAQTRGPGQAVAHAVMGRDILDPDEIIRHENSKTFHLVSGTVDGLSRVFLSPEVLAGAGVTRLRHVSRLRQRREYFTEGAGFDRFADDVGRLSDDVATVADDAATPPGVARETGETAGRLGGEAAAPGVIDEPRWHGSPREFDEDFVLDWRSIDEEEDLLFGGGLYTASNKNVAAAHAGESGSVTQVVWTRSRPPRILDLDAPMPDDVRGVARQVAEETFEAGGFNVAGSTMGGIRGGERMAEYRRVLDDPASTWDDFYSLLRQDGYAFVDMRDRMMAIGVDAYRFQGGVPRVGSAAQRLDDPYEVTVWLDEDSIALSPPPADVIPLPPAAGGVARETGETAARTADDADALAGRLREKYFPTHGDGDLIAHELAAAYHGTRGYTGGPDSMRNAMRFFMGDATAADDLAAESPAVAHRLRNFLARTNRVEDAVPPGTPGRNAARFDADQDIPVEAIDDLAPAFAAIDEVLKPTTRRNVADKVNHSMWYRTHWSMRPVRVMRDMRPQHFVWAGDANAGEQVARFLREAGFTPDEITAFRGEWARTDRFARARDLTPKYQTRAVERVIKEYFPDADKSRIADLLEDFQESSRSARTVLTNARKYDADPKLSTIAWMDDAGEMHPLQVPLTPGQLQQTVALVDIKELRAVLSKLRNRDPEALSKMSPYREAGARGKAATQPVFDRAGQGIGVVMSVWRAAVLLRPAWAMRVVGDEQLRMMAKIGTLTRLKGLWNEDWPNYVERVLAKQLVDDGVVDESAVRRLKGTRAAVTGGLGFAVAGFAGAAAGVGLSAIRNRRAIERLRRKVTVRNEARDLGVRGDMPAMAREHLDTIGEGPLDILGYQVDRAFGDPVEPQILWEKANSANRASGFLLDSHEGRMLAEVTEELGKWDTFEVATITSSKQRDQYGRAWERIINDQYGSNDVGRIAFDGAMDDAGKADRAARLVEWLGDPTGSGPRFRQNNPGRFPTDEAVEQWADAVVEAADRMLTEPSLRAKLANGERVRFSDVRRVAKEDGLGSDGWRDYVGDIHWQEATIVTDQSIRRAVKNQVDNLFDRIGTVTTNNLSRNPYFRHVYETEMRRRIQAFKTTAGDYELSEQALEAMQESARRKALQETRDLLYDLAERSEFSDMMRNVMPFFNAWGEVLSRWAGLAVENPAWVARASQVLRQDFDVGGYFQTVEVDDEKYFQLRLPEFAKDVIESSWFGKAIDEQGTLRFRADSINMVTQVVPGVGPIVQVAASKIVDYDPRLEDAFRLVLPYGPTRGGGVVGMSLEAFQPAWLKRVTADIFDTRSYESQAATIMLTRMAEMADGERPQIDFGDGAQVADFLQEVKDDASNFMYLRAIASAFSPASVGFHSPYQDYIDQYRQLKANNPRTADDEFLKILLAEDKQGFFALSARFSKSNEGLPATIEAEETRQRYIDLIYKYPEIGGLIIGIEGGGEAKFSAAVYERQLREETSPGSGMTRRERMSLREILTDSRVREGWVEYGRINDIIYNEMRARGLPNLRVAAARDLLAVKKAAVEDLGKKYPRWYKVHQNPDLMKWPDRIAGMRAIVEDERLAQRDDIRLIGEYLEMRDVVTGELSRRSKAGGSADITSGSNADLRRLWEAWTDGKMNNPTFSDLLWRWLEFDIGSPISNKKTWPESQRGK